jgi:hypothetical protein
VTKTDAPELLVDRRLIRAALLTPLALALPAIALTASSGMPAVLAALWGVGTVGVTAVAAAWLSALGGKTSRGIGIGRVAAAVPVRLVLVAAALAIGVGPLGFPSRVVALAVCAAEISVLTAQSWVVLRGRTFVGPLTGKG